MRAMMPNRITYDPEATALYMSFRDAVIGRTEDRGKDVFVDLDADGLIGIEMLDVDADLTGVIGEFGLDPHLLDVLSRLRALIPEARKELVLA
jgi:uncharacterized protein YuzE